MEGIEMIPVISSYVSSIGYDPQETQLIINYFNGTQTTFTDVPAGVHDDLMTALSKGSYVRTIIERTYDSI